MDCSEIKDILSAYYDGELSPEVQATVAEHLEYCDQCSQEIESFQGLSNLARDMADPQTPLSVWHSLEGQLGESHAAPGRAAEGVSIAPNVWNWRSPTVRLGLATAALMLIAIGWIIYTARLDHSQHDLTAVFDQYLEEFARDPHAAQQILLTHYEGEEVAAADAMRTIGYRPVFAGGMPDGYAVDLTYVMKMPCCTCVQCICERSDGTCVAIFEHDDEEFVWFGHRPVSEVRFDDVVCRVVDLGDRLAVTWNRNERLVTIIGLHDEDEARQFVLWFNEQG
jgi:hypothetical protein